MAITFYTQSKKNPSNIYVRIREGRDIDAKAKTNFKIDPSIFIKGRVRLVKIPPNVDAMVKKENQELNRKLIELQNKINYLNSYLTNLLNDRKDYETINSKWLKATINPKKDNESIPSTLVGYFQYYLDFKKSSLKPSTIKKLKVFKARIVNYENDKGVVYIQEVNKKFALSMQKWCDDNKYAHNTKVKTLKVILTVCNHAIENGISTDPELQFITKSLKYKNTDIISLDFDEIRQIMDTEIEDGKLSIAKDWLIISCNTAQRVSDFLRFTKREIVFKDGEYLLDIKQQKTDNPVYLPLDEDVMKILNKRNGEFPPVFSKNHNSNSTIYNLLIKEVCEIAKINNIVTANIRNKDTNRYELKDVPKYKAITTHIGRRSFATNYYGLIDTSLLISATGHATEVQFLRYVGKKGTQNAILLAKEIRELKKRLSKEREVKSIKLEVIDKAN